MKTATTILAALLLAAGAHAEQVWRCGSSYSQQPCAGGTPVQVEDARSAAQSQQAGQQVQRDAKAAEAMEKSRLALEAKAPQAAVIPLPERAATEAPATPEVTRPEKRKTTHAKKKSAKPEYFTAVAPGSQKSAKKKSPKKKSA